MKILAIDTATQVAGVALLSENKLISESIINHQLNHSKKLMNTLDQMLENVELKYNDLDYLSVAIGPGSFTGLRIGLATTKAIAQVTNLPIIPVSTLESLAYNISYSSGIVCPLLDARRNQVYSALFQTNNSGKVKRLTQDSALNLEDLKEILNSYNQPIFFLGDGSEKFMKDFITSENRLLVEPYLRLCQPSSVGVCALNHLDQATDFIKVEPSYLRPSYAEENK